MKTRIGFVSNSSSTNFVVVGNELKWEEVLARESIENLYGWGDSIDEGDDYFPLTSEMVQLVRDLLLPPRLKVIEQHAQGDGDWGLEITRDDMPPTFKVYAIKADYYRTETIEEFERRYIDED